MASHIQPLIDALFLLAPLSRAALRAYTVDLPISAIGDAVSAVKQAATMQDQMLREAIMRDPTLPERLQKFLQKTFNKLKSRAETEERTASENIFPSE